MSSWRVYDATNGLHGNVRSLFQDSKGYLWVGSLDSGLYRFDGARFDNFTVHDGLPSNRIEAILEDPADGSLWLATLGGISHYKGGRFVNYGAEHGLPHRFTWSLCLDLDGRLWCTTRAGVACRIADNRFKAYSEADGLPSPRVGAVRCGKDGRLWFGTQHGVVSLDGEHFSAPITTSEGLCNDDVGALLVDSRGRVWCGSRGGLTVIDGECFTSFGVADGMPKRFVMSLAEDRDGRIWCGLNGGGVTCWDESRFVSYSPQDGLGGTMIRAIVQVREGAFFFGADDGVLTRFDPHTWTTPCEVTAPRSLSYHDGVIVVASQDRVVVVRDDATYSRSFPELVVYVVRDANGHYWVVTDATVYRFDSLAALLDQQQTPAFQADRQQVMRQWQFNTFSPVLATRDGAVWAGDAWDGWLCRLDQPAFPHLETGFRGVTPICEDRHGRIWLCSNRQMGIICLHDGLLDVVLPEGEDLDIGEELRANTGVEDQDGLLWLATNRGLAVFDPETREYVDRGARELTLVCQCLAIDARGRVWVGTYGGGVYCFYEGVFQVLTRSDGLPSNTIHDIVPRADGSVLIATTAGLVSYHPTATDPPVVNIAEVIADRTYVSPVAVELTHPAASLVTIVFRGSALSTLKVVYLFRLIGVDAEWRRSWESQVRYRALDVGEYIFEVIAVNRDFVRSEEPARVTIRVVPSPMERQLAEYQHLLGEMEEELQRQRRMREQDRILVELARTEVEDDTDFARVLERMARASIRMLGVDRVSAWFFAPADGSLRCTYCLDRQSGEYHDLCVLDGDHLSALRAAVDSSRIIEASDARTDSSTKELSDDYLEPNRVVSVLVAPVRSGDRLVCLLLHETVDERRQWSVEDEYLAVSNADVLGSLWTSTERRQAEAALRESEERFRSAFEQAAVGMCHADLEGRYLRVNQRWCDIVGYSEGELLTMSYRDTTYAEDLPEDVENVQRLARGEIGTFSMEKRYQRKDGTLVWVNLTASVVRAADGTPKHFLGVIEDITLAKGLETQLRQAQKMQAVGQLAGGVAHDFNNLLQAIQGYTSMATMQLPVENKAYVYLKEACKAIDRAAGLVRQLLTLSRKEPIRRKPVDLTDLVANLARMLERILGEHIELVVECGDGIDRVYGDAGQVEQVLMNLCINARDAMSDGGRIVISTANVHIDHMYTETHPWAREGQYVCLSVADTGHGIPTELMDRVFEPFFTTKVAGQGTGMGLAIVYGIIQQHEGLINVRSERGAGATFEVYLPVAHICEINEPEHEESPPEQGSETILFAEDDELVRALGVQILEDSGYRVLVAKDGEEAIALYEANHETVALALLDVVMPKKNGKVVHDQIRAINSTVPVLFSSGYSFNALGTGALPQGEYELIQKPYSPVELLRRIRAILGTKEE